jgi:hypothetical protein
MSTSPLAPWRDASIILLALEAFVLALIPLAIAYLSTRGMRWVLDNTRLAFRWLAEKVYTIERIVGRICAMIAAPFVQANRIATGIRTTWQTWRLRRSKGSRLHDHRVDKETRREP